MENVNESLFGLDGLFWSYVPCFISDVLGLKSSVYTDRKSKFTVLHSIKLHFAEIVDDGTGVIACVLWNEQESKSAREFHLGYCYSLQGKVNFFNELKQLNVQRIRIVETPSKLPSIEDAKKLLHENEETVETVTSLDALIKDLNTRYKREYSYSELKELFHMHGIRENIEIGQTMTLLQSDCFVRLLPSGKYRIYTDEELIETIKDIIMNSDTFDIVSGTLLCGSE
ncbi:hypothetical protein ROZALSC1DRAFT_28112 [Rozella allomycis CSF55]|uniref:OB domain-containing protein n=1 Tax=Rozella allomycis (strain CSF55) TaxID=988480 RepID=A0A4P9YL78_ROZAC|nr:hypothetical protein ROZALSC1DRAFT_28112 [Rozella allomycis CSF55]